MDVQYLVAITLGLVEVVKKTGRVSDNWLPAISLAVGLVLGYFNGLDWVTSLLVGLTASGSYDLLKNPVQRVKDAIVK